MAEYVPYRPYKGTAGWSGTDTSKARALNNLLTGKEYNNQQKALALLKDNPAGITWKELSEAANVHHGTASGVLSVLHKAGAILRSANVRNRCTIYYHLQYSDSIINQVYKKKEKLCPHCGNDINA
jgi:DNA-binding MarR family transcriptional regulator